MLKSRKLISIVIWITSILLFSNYVYHNENIVNSLRDELHITKGKLDKKHNDLVSFKKQTEFRDYLEYRIINTCQLKNPKGLSKLSDEIFFTIIDEIEKYDIPYSIFFRLIDHESGFEFIENTQGTGAFGYCQVLPSTFDIFSKMLNIKNGHNEINNIKVGAYVLKYAFDIYCNKGLNEKESWYMALIMYSGGSKGLAKDEMLYYNKDLRCLIAHK
jgi:hypothetical protein